MNVLLLMHFEETCALKKEACLCFWPELLSLLLFHAIEQYQGLSNPLKLLAVSQIMSGDRWRWTSLFLLQIDSSHCRLMEILNRIKLQSSEVLNQKKNHSTEKRPGSDDLIIHWYATNQIKNDLGVMQYPSSTKAELFYRWLFIYITSSSDKIQRSGSQW